MPSNERVTTYSRDTVGPYYTDKNNKNITFEKMIKDIIIKTKKVTKDIIQKMTKDITVLI
jgi:hypothetical protein